MNNNLVLFYLYIVITLLLLVPLCYLISIQLFKIIYSTIFSYLNYNLYLLNFNIVDSNKSIKFFNLYIQEKQWFLCISMLELVYEKEAHSNIILLSNLAYCYKSLNLWQIAEYYYLKALFYSPSNLSILNNLSNLYMISNNINKAEKINRRILLLKNNV
uniref:Putative chloroplast RF37 n=1 Tax=Cumathamnion serrulatum TaxID=1206573 RepID=A0A7U1AR21_9FLOR|nr:putative chloroplast RF37 [Cumathamnion serrulatum]QQY85350.1 putative chloroplast RF37 [Cumathamnion serrulatum]